MDRLGEDFDRNFSLNQKKLERLANQKVWRAKAGQFMHKITHLATSQRYRPQFQETRHYEVEESFRNGVLGKTLFTLLKEMKQHRDGREARKNVAERNSRMKK